MGIDDNYELCIRSNDYSRKSRIIFIAIQKRNLVNSQLLSSKRISLSIKMGIQSNKNSYSHHNIGKWPASTST